MTAMVMTACTGQKAEKVEATQDNFNYVVDQFADLQILRYQVPGFESFSLKQKQLLYHLSEAALMGRDILFDQNCRYNLPIRRALEAVYTGYKGDRTDPQFVALETYLKRVWFANGIHHHYAEDKFVPGFTPEFFRTCISQIGSSALPLREGQTVEQFVAEISPVIFDPAVMAKRTVQSGDVDLIRASANNYYGEGVTQVEVEDFYARMKAGKDTISPISYGLNQPFGKRERQVGRKSVEGRRPLFAGTRKDRVGIAESRGFCRERCAKVNHRETDRILSDRRLENLRCLFDPMGGRYGIGC